MVIKESTQDCKITIYLIETQPQSHEDCFKPERLKEDRGADTPMFLRTLYLYHGKAGATIQTYLLGRVSLLKKAVFVLECYQHYYFIAWSM